MRSELEEVRLIDCYLFGRLEEDQRRAFDARLLIDNALGEKVFAQRTLHRLVLRLGRAKDRARFDAIFRQLLGETHFSQQINAIFT